MLMAHTIQASSLQGLHGVNWAPAATRLRQTNLSQPWGGEGREALGGEGDKAPGTMILKRAEKWSETSKTKQKTWRKRAGSRERVRRERERERGRERERERENENENERTNREVYTILRYNVISVANSFGHFCGFGFPSGIIR